MGVPDVSVIVVSADSGPGLHDCVRRALASPGVREVLLIDNGSRDAVPEAVARAFEQDMRLTVVFNHANLGFGPAVNRAVKRTNGQRLLVLNPDCLLEPDTVPRLIEAFDAQPRTGLVGAVVCDARGVPDPASYRRDPLLVRSLNTMFNRPGEGVNVEGPMPDHAVEAEAVSGALMLISRRLFDYIGGFDEGYFLHCEDLDLCRRMRNAGYRVMLAGDVRVLHGKGGSSRHRPVFVSWHKHRGMWRWFRKFDPAARKPHVAALVWLGIWAHFALQVPGQLLRRRTSITDPA
ncbi:MAG: glycosyl transferase family 2 [Lysobacterales bacterium 13-68-4]|nr:MAG: glycosyl transferase family 2 [Xanthomonadales bacterium 13-68-4]